MTEEKRPTPSKIPYIFVAFFAVIFLVNAAFIYFSNKTWRGIVTEDSYQKGLHYNDTLKQVETQKNLGWKTAIKYKNLGAAKGAISVEALDKNSAIIKGAKVYINCKRPTQEGFDFAQELKFDGTSHKAEITFPLKGQWDVEVVVTKDENVFQEVKRYVIQ